MGDLYARFRRQATGQELVGYELARRISLGRSAEWLQSASEEALWEEHAALMERWRGLRDAGGEPPGAAPLSLLDLKVELAQRLLGPCRLCWLRCPVDRRAGQTGACGLGAGLRPYQDFVHLGEELELIPTHAVYLAGCSYRCAYCSDWPQVVGPQDVPEVDPLELSRSIDARRREGVLSLSFVGGSPDVSLPGILRALAGTQESVPVVWNSNLSGTEEAHRLLEGVADAWVADLKYGSEVCAQAGSAVKGSLAVARRNLLRAAGEAYTVVRHLVLPGHVECCALPVLDWLAERLPGARVNLMDQYQAPRQARGTPWDQALAAGDMARARAHAETLPLDLTGPGPLQPPHSGSAVAPTSAQAAGFSSKIAIGPGGEVVIENLSPELLDLVQGLGDLDPNLHARVRAGRAWRSPPAKP